MLDYLREHPDSARTRLDFRHRGDSSGGQSIGTTSLEQSGYQRGEAQRLGGYRTILAVPMLSGETCSASSSIWKTRVEPFTDNQIELVTTFADQAVIAIENVRLFNELEARNRDLTEALEQQTATSEILRVISQSPTDVQPVFDTIAASALKLCVAGTASVATFDGELVHLGAAGQRESGRRRRDPAGLYPRPPSHDNGTARAILTRRVVVIPDIIEDPDYAVGGRRARRRLSQHPGGSAVARRSPIGAIAVGRPQPGPFSDNQVALLQTFADQAVIAIENVRLFTELGDRNRDLSEALEQQTATSEILKVIGRSPSISSRYSRRMAANAVKAVRRRTRECLPLRRRSFMRVARKP